SAAAAAFLRRFFEHIRGKSLPGDSGDDIFRRHGIALNEEENAYVRGLSYLKYGFWDMLLKNCFYVDGSYHFFDQEWLEYNVPLEYIVYRNVLEFRLSEAETDALFDAFGIRHPRIFDALDTALMCAPRSKDSFFLRGYRKTADVLQQAGAERDALQKAMADKDRQIADLQNGLNGVFHSTSWKMTAPLRAVSKGIKFLGKG
ncbi:MAG: hypothetical protein FWF49_05160, partial [Oscillospiraceae bacterium]|nr:hypothetical protein [Oscillospiraceae bacterium]